MILPRANYPAKAAISTIHLMPGGSYDRFKPTVYVERDGVQNPALARALELGAASPLQIGDRVRLRTAVSLVGSDAPALLVVDIYPIGPEITVAWKSPCGVSEYVVLRSAVEPA